MYTLITAKSLWTIICIGEITVLFVWLLEYGKDLLHVQYGRLHLANLSLGTPTHIYTYIYRVTQN